MARLLLVAVLVVLLFGWASPPLSVAGRRQVKRLALGALLAAGFIAALRAGLVSVAVLGLGIVLALRFALPILLRQLPGKFQNQRPFSSQSAAQVRSANSMTRAQAFEVLNLREGASREEIITSYRELIRKVHPDRGGSSYLAAEVNRARDVLLG